MGKTKKSFYKIFYIVLILLAVGTGYFFYRSQPKWIKKTAVQPQSLTVYLKLTEGDFTKAEVASGKTALDFTKEKAKIEAKGEGVSAYVVAINGIKAQDSKKEFWSFYINGKMAEVGAGSYILKNGDKIEWKLKNY